MLGNIDFLGSARFSIYIDLKITVKIVAEKKGLFLKNSEYEVETKTYDGPKVVRRRYKDFVELHSYLLDRYPYRMIPVLPPKQLVLESLLEQRRHGLQTWLNVVNMHPVFTHCSMMETFLLDTTDDYQYRMRVAYEKQMDEFSRLREDVELDIPSEETLLDQRNALQKTFQSLNRLRNIFDEQAFRVEQHARALAEADAILRGLHISDMHERVVNFANISESVEAASKLSKYHVKSQRSMLNEKISAIITLLAAHNTLCERVHKGIFADYQKALSKTASGSRAKCATTAGDAMSGNGSIPTKKESAEAQAQAPPQSPVNPEASIHRKYAFAMRCVLGETGIVEQFLQLLPRILMDYAREASQYHNKMSMTWHQLVANETASKL